MKMTHCTVRILLLVLLSLTVCTQPSMLAQTTAQGQSALPPVHYIPSREYDQRDIKLDLRFDWEQEQATGTETITLAPLVKDLRRVELDAANMTFNSVKLVTGPPLKFEMDAPAEKLRIDLDRAYQPTNVLTLVLYYQTNAINTPPGIAGLVRLLAFSNPGPDLPAGRR